MKDYDGDAGVLNRASSYALEYRRRVSRSRFYPDETALNNLLNFREPVPEKGSDDSAVIDMLHRWGAPAAVASTGGRYFGFVTGGITNVGLAASWMADAWDQNAALYVTSPIAATLEEVLENWLTSLLSLPPKTAAAIVSGAATAILCALTAGRNELCRRRGWDVRQDGLAGAPRIRVLVSEQAHSTVARAVAILGLGANSIEPLECDSQGRVRPDCIPDLDETCLVVLQAGNVNGGSFDPFEDIALRTREAGAWLHIDGAFGLWARACPSLSYLCRGAELADSWSVDAHKTLNAPYDCGVVLCEDRNALSASMQTEASYIQWSANRDNMAYSPEMSRRARAIPLWATIKSLGRNGIATQVEKLHTLAGEFARLLAAAGFEICNNVQFNQVLVAGRDDEETSRTLEGLQSNGEIWCSGATWNFRKVIRISVCSFATTRDDIHRAAAAFSSARSRIPARR